ncbi:Na+-transporting methylmalonyl-CoA/oxaloacetate decarboxylase%2C gamma subunit [uncultured Clostridium sp.]|uniref:OadG family protein n=1 Tax=Paeniclostridium hominis TaxID=2764329 RepID=A0ABR7K0Z0_9FIRM|nr:MULTISPECIES: OadG family protein [Paeniclostridium]MBC6002773.1 OadG family protein [Paeniclostridium hominis]SCI91792.1 Na+-transporting methylmalonyl-CoA/oxaloacetate decarboxylase%2C gamma subunit [uncultured Clostridium sp.]SCJ04056.1 Na+-transporting methylmalonyl-CoA/oxaloacetate decarboxylase%2C gamma subunit [uncultured Clostridium sp.]
MNISQLLEAVKDPSSTLSMGEKLLAGVSVAVLSMAVVFIVLVVIALIITILQRDGSKKVKEDNIELIKQKEDEIKDVNNNEDLGELVSVITAAIAATTGNSTNNIVVRKIQRSNNTKTSWERMAKNTTK